MVYNNVRYTRYFSTKSIIHMDILHATTYYLYIYIYIYIYIIYIHIICVYVFLPALCKVAL